MNCIYLDFEGRVEQPPILLGELCVDERSERFAQWILDPGLASAAVARRHLHVSSLRVVAERLAEFVAQEKKSIVAWSNHEASVFAGLLELDDRHRRELLECYVNAIRPAKAWRRALLPGWVPAEEDLKSYFIATEYKPKLPSRTRRRPAAWIEHTQRRVVQCGSYSKVGPTVKRDWQHLLTYNEDDCRGLRHVHEVTTRELALWNAYSDTTFEIDGAHGFIHVRIGQRGKRLQRLVKEHRAQTWAVISAANPASALLSDAANAERHRELIAAVSACGLPWVGGRGLSEDSDWRPEESLFVPGISHGKALVLGRRFGQLAIVFGRRDEPARLVSCRMPPLAAPEEDS